MCGRRVTGERKGARRLAVDHDHVLASTHGHDPDRGCRECIRGLLCSNCNSYVAWIRDDPGAARRLYDYLRFPPAAAVLLRGL